MYKILNSLLFIAAFAAASAFTPISKPVVNDSKQDSPTTMLTIDLSQTGPGAALGTWTSTNNTLFRVSLGDLTTGIRTEYQTTATSLSFSNLTIKHLYRLSVWDGDNFISDDELITF